MSHSYGGLVVQDYLVNKGSKNIIGWIPLSSPLAGTRAMMK